MQHKSKLHFNSTTFPPLATPNCVYNLTFSILFRTDINTTLVPNLLYHTNVKKTDAFERPLKIFKIDIFP